MPHQSKLIFFHLYMCQMIIKRLKLMLADFPFGCQHSLPMAQLCQPEEPFSTDKTRVMDFASL